MDIRQIRVIAPFKDLFNISPMTFEAIERHMRENGYDDSQPITIWGSEQCIIDGFTRFKAAQHIGLNEIPVVELHFSDELEALEYAVHNQRDRRNLTGPEIMRLVNLFYAKYNSQTHDKKKRAKKTDVPSSESETVQQKRTSEKVADTLGIGRGTVEKIKVITDEGIPEVVQAVEAGEMTINRGYQETVQEKQKKKSEQSSSMLIKADKSIEIAKYIWNPFDPTFMFITKDAIDKLKNTKITKNIELKNCTVYVSPDRDIAETSINALNSLSDIFEQSSQFVFIIWSRQPEKLEGVNWPLNSILLFPIESQEESQQTLSEIKNVQIATKGLICKVDQQKYRFSSTSFIDWFILEPGDNPSWEVVESIIKSARDNNCSIFFKNNLTIRPKEFPVVSTNHRKSD